MRRAAFLTASFVLLLTVPGLAYAASADLDAPDGRCDALLVPPDCPQGTLVPILGVNVCDAATVGPFCIL